MISIHRILLYSNTNIGIYARAWDDVVILPSGYPDAKTEKLASILGVHAIRMSIAGTRLIGPLLVFNSHGLLATRFISDAELQNLRALLRDKVVERFMSRSTAVGNLVLVNDKGAIVSERLSGAEVSQIRDVLDVEVEKSSIAGYHQVGSVAVANNKGALVHPMASDDELSVIADVMKLEDVDRGTVNGGVPFVSSGIILNNRVVLVGFDTTGPELFMISKVFKAEY